jgi:hypothetical protein
VAIQEDRQCGIVKLFCLSFTRTPRFQHTLLQPLFVMPIGCDHISTKALDPIRTQMLNLGESSTRMGDLLGSPRVMSLLGRGALAQQ